MVEKGLTSTKPAAKQRALDAILLYVELDKADPIIEELLPLLSHKTPKVITATLSAFTSMYHEFGCKTVEPKSVLKALPKIYGHADKNVRAEAQSLTVELYRWLKEGIKPFFWNELKPVQQQDLEKLFEKVKDEPAPQPERLLRSQQAKQAAAAAASAQEDEGDYAEPEEEDDGGEIDLEPEAVDVFPKLPKDLNDRVASTKWKDRKDVIEEVHTAVDVPSIQEGPFDDVVRALAKCMKDANIAVVNEAATCIELLAKGLRKSFSKYRSIILDQILERLKERKQSVVDALTAAIDAVVAYASISDYLETTLPFLQHKNPQVKLESTRFLMRSLKSTREAPSVPEVKMVSDSATKLLTDSQETQRNAGAEILGVLLKIMGERIMSAHLEGLDDIRKSKIKEFAESAEVKAKYTPKAAPPPKAAAAPAGKKPVAKKPAGAAPATKKAPADAAPAPLQPKPTARPGLPKPGAPRGLKPPTAAAPAKKLAQPASQSASPRKNVVSPPVDDEHSTAPKTSRGLTGRQLNKPAEPLPTQQHPPPNNSLPSIERIELDELRAETERLRGNNDRLHRENSSLQTRVQELEDQNAQLIEDHTRDVLSIKAKETQLVRARSDAESAEQTSNSLQREVDRLKRELGRTARATSPRASDYGTSDYQPDVKNYAGGVNGDTHGGATMSPFREGKENLPSELSISKDHKSYLRDDMLSPPPRSAGPPRPTSRSTNPSTASPVRSDSMDSRGGNTAAGGQPTGRGGIGAPPSYAAAPPPSSRSQSRPNSGQDTGAGATTGAGKAGQGGQGQESWRRAAEVTQNLKARIELMRVSPSKQPTSGLKRF